MLKILIVDNNILFREGLSNLLKHEPGIQVLGDTGTIFHASHIIRSHAPDVVLVDAEVPDLDKYTGIRQLLTLRPQMVVILLTTAATEDQMLSAVRNGARGYVAKNHSLSTLMASIRAVERGEAVIPRALMGSLLDELARIYSSIDPEGVGLLTPREVEVLRELGCGSSNRDIADRLEIAENTVKVHVHNILEKLGLSNRRQAAHFARCHNIAGGCLPRLFSPSMAARREHTLKLE